MFQLMAFSYTLLGSILAGCLIGMERQWRKKLAGMRTTALVCLGATMFVRLSMFIQDDASPTRIAAQVVSGIGFLAGGVIIREGFTVTGINTAATLWCSAAVGTLIGAGYFYEGLLGAVFITITNVVLRNLSQKVDQLSMKQQPTDEHFYYLSIICVRDYEVSLRTTLIQNMNHLHLNFSQLSFTDLPTGETEICLVIEGQSATPMMINHFSEKLSREEGVLTVEFLQEEVSE